MEDRARGDIVGSREEGEGEKGEGLDIEIDMGDHVSPSRNALGPRRSGWILAYYTGVWTARKYER